MVRGGRWVALDHLDPSEGVSFCPVPASILTWPDHPACPPPWALCASQSPPATLTLALEDRLPGPPPQRPGSPRVYQAAPPALPGRRDPPRPIGGAICRQSGGFPAEAAATSWGCQSSYQPRVTSASPPSTGRPVRRPLLPLVQTTAPCIIFSHSISTIILLK